MQPGLQKYKNRMHQIQTFWIQRVVWIQPDPARLITRLSLFRVTLVWWKDHAIQFPYLVKLATNFLTTPASSVYSDGLFSEYRNSFEEKPARLLPTTGEKLLFSSQFEVFRQTPLSLCANICTIF